MSGFGTPSLKDGLTRICTVLEDCADELNTVDGQLGDGDLGVTMRRGARSVMEEVDGLPDDVGMAFMKCAQAFTRISGSSYGTLLATGLMATAKACKGRTEVPWSEVSDLMGGAVAAMQARGKGELGDKTILDAMDAVRSATEGLSDPAEILTAADRAVDDTLETFRGQTSKLGRARMFGDKSIGLDDPGMLAFRRVVGGLKR